MTGEIIHLLPAVSNELEVPYVDLERGVPLADHVRQVAIAARDAEQLGWERARRYYTHEMQIREGQLEREITARITADLQIAREQNRLAWILLAALAVVVLLAIAAMVTA